VSGAPVLTMTIQVRFADLDPLGHVNHVQFLAFMETARVAFMHEHGGTLRGGVLVARAECDYRREISGSTRSVEVAISVESVGRTSFVVRHVITDGGAESGVGRVVLVAIGDDRRPRPLSDEERTKLLGAPS
jgi:acyl-CoA thioester hydrolase